MVRWANKVAAPFWYVGPSYGLAKDTIWNDPRMLPSCVADWHNANSTLIKKSETELRIEFKTSGGQIYIYGSDRPDLMRGPNPFGVVLDEYSVMRPEVWEEIIQPIMRSNPKAWCWFLFTPRGKNHAFRAFQLGQERRNNEWMSWKLDVYESGIFTPEQIANARETMTSASFNQELMCEFLEGEGAVFRNTKEVMTAIPHKPLDGHLYVAGVDLAKHQDYTVLAVYDRATNAQVYQDRFQQLEWPFIKKKIKAVADHFNRAVVALDATGIGDPIADDLIRAGVIVEPIKITEQSKKDLIEKLSIWIDQKRLRMLPVPETIAEFENFSYEMGPTGRIHYGAPQGFNDDIVIAHALAIWSLNPLYKERLEPSKTTIQKIYEQQKKDFEQAQEHDYEWDEWANI